MQGGQSAFWVPIGNQRGCWPAGISEGTWKRPFLAVEEGRNQMPKPLKRTAKYWGLDWQTVGRGLEPQKNRGGRKWRNAPGNRSACDCGIYPFG